MKMKLSPNTIQILKNFAGINQSIVFKAGNVLQTISGRKDTLATATVEENFPSNFGIYDLNEFLSTMSSLFVDPSFEVMDNHLLISDDSGSKRTAKCYFVDESMIQQPPEDKSKIIKAIKASEVKFYLDENDFNALKKAAGVLGSPELVVESDGDTIQLSVVDTKNPTSNKFTIEKGEGNGDSFRMIFRNDAIRVLSGGYNISISSMGLSHFQHEDGKLEYYISLESSSKYNRR